MKNLFSRFSKNESGATAIEYGLIAALVAVVVVGALMLMGPQLEATFGEITNALTPE
ncbi:Flp family type IVb pilin [Paracoccus sp. Z118]|uniref:Flp family type IVb pilin n=1 Tax=Paracoccus sp. Z118 TaxID=2851017 RepID=UPI001C2C89AD|nr:Flp family type IVb pilin [Paracoccus sp. Z118]MBV0893418.1 Flp family type IVb pilin [Paracoccus sp. Z118]